MSKVDPDLAPISTALGVLGPTGFPKIFTGDTLGKLIAKVAV